MSSEEYDDSEGGVSQDSTDEVSFNLPRVLSAAVLAGMLGATASLVMTSTLGLDWTLRLVIAPHAALSFAIMSGWAAATFSKCQVEECTAEPMPVLCPANEATFSETHRDHWIAA